MTGGDWGGEGGGMPPIRFRLFGVLLVCKLGRGRRGGEGKRCFERSDHSSEHCKSLGGKRGAGGGRYV